MTAAELMEAAREARRLSYSPYSHFAVGAALECADGSVYLGANIENASYPATNCAERTAFFRAIADGKREFRAIAVSGGTGANEQSCPPCGVCRQVMREFCKPGFAVFFSDGEGGFETFTLDELLPRSFGPENL